MDEFRHGLEVCGCDLSEEELLLLWEEIDGADGESERQTVDAAGGLRACAAVAVSGGSRAGGSPHHRQDAAPCTTARLLTSKPSFRHHGKSLKSATSRNARQRSRCSLPLQGGQIVLSCDYYFSDWIKDLDPEDGA